MTSVNDVKKVNEVVGNTGHHFDHRNFLGLLGFLGPAGKKSLAERGAVVTEVNEVRGSKATFVTFFAHSYIHV